jgi:hypothetical protein
MLALQTARKQQKYTAPIIGKRQTKTVNPLATMEQKKNFYYNSQLKKKLKL